MIGRRQFFLNTLHTFTLSIGACGTRAFSQEPEIKLCSDDTNSEFRTFIFGRNDDVPQRMSNYEQNLLNIYHTSYSELRTFADGVPNSVREKYAAEAERTRGIDVNAGLSKNGIGYAVQRDGKRFVYLDEGLINVAISYAYTYAHIGAGDVSQEEIDFWWANLFDALRNNDPIPYFRGFNGFHRSFVEGQWPDQRFFFQWNQTLNSILGFVLFHEIGHHVKGHHNAIQRELSNPSASVSDWTDRDFRISRGLEDEADQYSIDICYDGLGFYATVAFLFVNVFNYMRRKIIASRGGDIYPSHYEPTARIGRNLDFFGSILDDAEYISTLHGIYDRTISLIDDLHGNSEPFSKERFGDFSAPDGLPESYYRFYRRDCNIANFRTSGIVISGPDGQFPVELGIPPSSLEPIGSCHVDRFIPF